MLAVWALVIAWWDWRYRRIPNWALILVLVPASLALAFNGQGLLGAGLLASLAGFAMAALLLPGYALGQMGAGDVKLFATLGLLQGGWMAVDLLLLSALGVGALALGWRLLRPAQQRLPAASAFVAAFLIQLATGPIFLP